MTPEYKAKRTYNTALLLAKAETPDLEKVSKLLATAAKLGSHEANYALATWYLHGKHFKLNFPKAVVFLKRAAKSGNGEACSDLAICYETGSGVKKNMQRAFELYLEAALRDEISAYREVARCFWHGYGIEKNRTLARLWGELHKTKSLKFEKGLKPPSTSPRV